VPALRFANELITQQSGGTLSAAAVTMSVPVILRGSLPAFPFWLASDDGPEITVRGEKRRTTGEVIEVTGEAGGEWTIVRARGTPALPAAEHLAGTIWTLCPMAEQMTALYFRSSTVGNTRVAISPAAGTYNNYELPDGELIACHTPVGGITFTGFKGGVLAPGVGRTFILENEGPGPLSLVPLAAGSEAANELEFETAETQVLRPFELAVLAYANGRGKWHNVSIPILTALTQPAGVESGEPAALGVAGQARGRVASLEGNGVVTTWEWNPLLGATAGGIPTVPTTSVAKQLGSGAWEQLTLASLGATVTYPPAAAGAERMVKVVFAAAPAAGTVYSFTTIG
jgi:hypothetical protein